MKRIPRQRLRAVLAFSVFTAPLAISTHSAEAQQPTTPSAPTALSLGDAARLAARQSALAQGAQLRADQADARVRQDRADLLPTLSADASQSARTFNTASFGISFPSEPGQPPLFDPNGQVEGPVNTTDIRGHLSAPLLNLAAIGRVRSSQATARAFDANADVAAEQSAAAAAGAYLRTLRGEATLQARLADSVLAIEVLGIARDQLAAGVGVALDVTRAESQLAGVRAQIIAARNDRDRARLELRRTLNVPLDAPIELTDSLALLDSAALLLDEQAAVEQAMRERPDVRALEEQLQAASRQASAIRSERLPTLGVFGDQGITGLNPEHLLPTYTVGVQVSVPIFDGFRRSGRIQEQQLVVRELDVRRRDMQQQVAVEVRGALLDLSSAKQQVAAVRERQRLAELEVAQARERFSAGVSGNADVITASLTLNMVRTQLVDALTAYQAARVALAHAEGAITDLR